MSKKRKRIRKDEPITIIIDTREKTPWRFRGDMMKLKLDYGDYAPLGFENVIRIERKGSLSDLFMSLGRNRNRFMKSMEKMIENVTYPFLVIEANLCNIYAGLRYSKMHPKSVVGSLFYLMERGVTVLFVGKTRNTPKFISHLITRRVRLAIQMEEDDER